MINKFSNFSYHRQYQPSLCLFFYYQFLSIDQNNTKSIMKLSQTIQQNSDEASSEQQQLIQAAQLDAFNQQYSLIYQMSKKFFQYSKQAIMKYINYTRFGAKLNVGLVSNWLVSTSQMMNQKNNFKKSKDVEWTQKKQLQFQQILQNIKVNISEMLDFERNFKNQFIQNYKHKQKTPKKQTYKTESPPPPVIQNKNTFLQQSIKSEASKRTQISIISIESDKRSGKISQRKQQLIQQELRKNLRNILRPHPQTFLKQAQSQKGNITSISQKIKRIKEIMNQQKEREKKIFDIFEKNKIIIPDVDNSHPAIEQLNNQINKLKQQIQKWKIQLKKKQLEIERLGQRLIKQMLRESQKNRQKIFQNQNVNVFFHYKNQKFQYSKIPKFHSLDKKYLIAYIFTLQQKICDTLQFHSKNIHQQQKRRLSPSNSSSSINLNLSFTNVYSPIELKNIINPSFLKKK